MFATDRRSLFEDTSLTLFRTKSIVFIVVASHGDVLGSSELSRERDELGERCEALKRENSDVENELNGLRANDNAFGNLQEQVNQYGKLSYLAAQIEKLKASLAEGEKNYKKVFENSTEACWAFEADRKDLQ